MATTTNLIKMTIKLRRDTFENWELHKTEVPAEGEPCFIIDKNILKIGDGHTEFQYLEPINGVELSGDGKSIILEGKTLKLAGFDDATAGMQLRKGEDGTLEWFTPSTETVEDLQSDVTGLQTSVTGLESDVADLQAIVGTADEGSGTLLSRIESLEKDMDTFVTSMDDDGKVETLKELIEYVNTHGQAAADMASEIESLNKLVGSDPVADQILAAITASETKANAVFEHVKYEISSKPVGTLVDYRDKEIRVMIPAGTQFEHQTSGTNFDANAYYIGFKAYAPDGAVSFREDLAEIISDTTDYYFEGNEFAGVDEYGRKYSIVWLPVAKYADGVWTYYGDNSSKDRYIGWYYSVEWYGADGKCIGSDCIRINLSNKDCHNAVEPFYMANVIKGVSVNGTLLDAVDGVVNVEIAEQTLGVKSSDEIDVAEDGTLSIKQISISKIVQDDDTIIVMDGGAAV